MDWRFPGYFDPEKHRDSAEAMIQQCHAQVRELMSNYGTIDLLWYDGDWIAHGQVTTKSAEFWRSKGVNEMARKLQPHLIINNNRSGLAEDLDTPEQHVTASQPGRGWEACMTIGDSCGWGYVKNNPNWKTQAQLLQTLVIAAAGEGNFLLNIGPAPDGTIRKEEQVKLLGMGKWLEKHGEAIYGSERCSLQCGMIGTWTKKGNTGYLHVCRWPGNEVVVPLVKTKVKSATLLTTGKKATVRQEKNGRLVISGLPTAPPDPNISVIKVEFDGKPQGMSETDRAAWLAGKAK